MMILLIDNYDSFVYNLYQLIGAINPTIKVVRNDEITINEIEQLQPSHIILSPGPGIPSEAGIIEEVIQYFYQEIPILGVCLGHQAIMESFGTKIKYAKELMHGKSSVIKMDKNSLLFKGVTNNTVARYHSLAGDSKTLSPQLQVIATSKNGEIMAVQHIKYPVYGVQFHPESVLTGDGKIMIKNFLGVMKND